MGIKNCRSPAWIAGLLIATFFSNGVQAADEQASPQQTASAWVLRPPESKALTFHGASNFDDSGVNQKGMLYPAPNALGLLAAVITHAVVVDSAKRSQLREIQAQADRVLDPYLPIIDKLDLQDMMARALAISRYNAGTMLLQPISGTNEQTVVESIPVFSMTQDQSAIVVDNLLAIQKPGTSAEQAYRNTIRVILPGAADDQVAHWSANNGEKLVEASIRALAESFDIAFDDANGHWKDEKPYRTVRYKEGNSERIERAQQIDSRCGRTILRNLRGTLISIPVPTTSFSSDTENCYRMLAKSANGS